MPLLVSVVVMAILATTGIAIATEELNSRLIQAFSDSDYATVVSILDDSAAELASESHLLYIAGISYLEQGRLDEARDVLLQRHVLFPYDLYVAQLLLELGEFSVLDGSIDLSDYEDCGIWEVQEHYSLPEDRVALPALLDEARRHNPQSCIPWVVDAALAEPPGAGISRFSGLSELMLREENIGNLPTLAELLVDAGYLEDAAELACAGFAARPGDYSMYYILSDVLEEQGRPDLLHDELAAAAQGNPPLPDLYYQLGLSCEERGEPLEALAAFDRAHELAPEDGYIEDSARILNAMGRPAEVVSRFEEMDPAPVYIPYFAELGLAYEALEMPEEALQQYELSLGADYYGNRVLFPLARVQEQLGMYEEALANVLESGEYTSLADPEAWLLASRCQAALGNHEAALREAYEVAITYPDNPAYEQYLDDLRPLMDADELAGLEREWRWGMEIDGLVQGSDDNPALALQRAWQQYEAGNVSLAMETVRDAQEILPEGLLDVERLLDLSLLLMRIEHEDIEGIEADFQQYRDEGLEDELSLLVAQLIAVEREDYIQALAYTDQILALSPDDVDMLNSKSAYLNEAGLYEEAWQVSSQALEIEPGNPESQLMHLYNAVDADHLDDYISLLRSMPDGKLTEISRIALEWARQIDESGETGAQEYLSQKQQEYYGDFNSPELIAVNLLLQQESRRTINSSPVEPHNTDYTPSAEEMVAVLQLLLDIGNAGDVNDELLMRGSELVEHWPHNPVVLATFMGLAIRSGRPEITSQATITLSLEYKDLYAELARLPDQQASAIFVKSMISEYCMKAYRASQDHQELCFSIAGFLKAAGFLNEYEEVISGMRSRSMDPELIRELEDM